MKCFHCNIVMSEQEESNYYKDAKYCCNGRDCGCMGQPIDPPYCDSCIETGRLATIGMALELAFKRLPYLGLVYGDVNKEEGCLSIPNKIISTNRYNEVHVINEIEGYEPIIATNFLAIACQHEIDHLDGILMTDRQTKPIINKIKIGPNEKCPCGSGLKYKKCCNK